MERLVRIAFPFFSTFLTEKNLENSWCICKNYFDAATLEIKPRKPFETPVP